MSENTPQNPYEPSAGGPTPPQNPSGSTPPTGPTELPTGPTPPPGPAQPPVAPSQPPYGGPAQPPAYAGPEGTYGTQPSGPFAVGEALGFAWNRFKGNWLFWVLFVLLLVIVFGIFNGSTISEYSDRANDVAEAQATGVGMGMGIGTGVSFGSTSLGIVGSLILSVLSALGINAALREVSGEKATWGNLFKISSYGMVILTGLLLLVANFIGLLLCGLGAIALAIFAPFTYHHVVDKSLGAWTALTSSFRLVGQNFGAVFLLELALLGINILGSIPCGLGLFITLPLSIVAMAFAFRRLTGGPISAGPAAA
ncbi:hypothetical protein AB1046_10250 [Promicromonospora sp. Populi]|uniref:hypothetical protein n=1 Tax=Promicromonospora sp. Populi TaxID=3239420 RepID=UPI0034E2EF02